MTTFPANLNRAPRTATVDALQAAYAAHVAPGDAHAQILALTRAAPRGLRPVAPATLRPVTTLRALFPLPRARSRVA